MTKKHNKKLPKDAVSEQDIEPKYGYIHGEWDALGGHHWAYLNPDEHKKYFSETLNASGSYKTTQQDDDAKEITTGLKPGEDRKYTAGGHSHQCDGHMDTTGEGTGRIEYPGDFAIATSKDHLLGVGGKMIKAIQDESHFNPEGSDSVYSEGRGTKRTSIKNNEYKHVEGDKVTMVEKNHVEVNQKDRSIYAKNVDQYSEEKGKIETGQTFLLQTGQDATVNSAAKMVIKSGDNTEITSQAEIKITADTKITIKVGSNSIEISSSGIVIDAQGGKLDLKASGDVTTQGATTKLQGGGAAGIPTTIT